MYFKGMSRRTALQVMAAAGTMLTTAPLRAKEPYPNRFSRKVVPVGPGFNSKSLARMVAGELPKKVQDKEFVDKQAA